MKLVLALALLFAVPASAQIVQLSGGSSTQYNATGGAITLFTPGLATQLDVGVFDGKLVGGATSNFEFQGWNVHAGDQPVTLTSGDLSLSAPVRGIVATKRKGDTQITFFTGLVGTAYAAPFFYAQRATKFGSGFSASTTFRGLELGSTVGIVAGQRTYLESVRKRWQHFQASETAGVLDNRSYFIAESAFSSDHFQAGLNHSDYIWQGENSAVNSENASFNARGFSAFGSAFQSKTVTGSTIGASWRVGLLDVRGMEVLSGQKSFLGSVTENVTQHFHVSQFYSRSNGSNSVNFGGGYTGNVVSMDVGWQEVFYPFVTKAPFQKTLAVTVSFQLPWHGTSVHLGTVASPRGGARWTAYAGTYATLPWEVPSGQQGQTGVRISGVEVRGTVLDSDGHPVAGAAVKIGREEVYTNEDGAFVVHLRSKGSAPVSVVLDDFTAIGSWDVVSAPDSASPDAPVQITIKRR